MASNAPGALHASCNYLWSFFAIIYGAFLQLFMELLFAMV
jgi:hypothetical protein